MTFRETVNNLEDLKPLQLEYSKVKNVATSFACYLCYNYTYSDEFLLPKWKHKNGGNVFLSEKEIFEIFVKETYLNK